MKKQHLSIAIFLLLCLTLTAHAFGQDQLKRAHDNYKAGNYQAALGLYQQALGQGGNPAIIYYNMANVCYLLKRPWQSIIYYQKVTAIAPRFIQAYLNLAKIYHEYGEYHRALPVLKNALTQQQNNEECLLLIGNCFQQLESPGQAIYYYTKAQQHKPFVMRPYYFIAETYISLKDYPSAIKVLTRATDMVRTTDRELARLYAFIGDLYSIEKDYASAVHSFEKSVRLDPTQKHGYYRLAECQLWNKQKFLAMETLKNSTRANPRFKRAYILLGSIQFDLGMYQQATSSFLQAIRISPDGLKQHIRNIAIVYYNNKDYISLKELYLKVRNISPLLAVVVKKVAGREMLP